LRVYARIDEATSLVRKPFKAQVRLMVDLKHEHAALQDQILQAKARGTLLNIQGLGSKDFYHALPTDLACEPLSTLALKHVINYEPTELFIQVASGTPLHEVEALLATQGQCLPFEPPRFPQLRQAPQGGNATIGGMVASGLSGPARASVGGVKDFILGAHLINGNAEHLVFGGQVMKNVAGYDVSRVLASSMGTLGVITQVSLKVLPIPLGDCSLKAHLPAHEALALMQRLGQRPLPLHSSAWCHDSAFSKDPQDVTFVLRLKGAKAATQSAMSLIGQELLALKCRPQELDRLEAQTYWDSVRDQTHAFFSNPSAQDASLWRISLPLKALKLGPPSLGPHAFTEWLGALHWIWANEDQAKRLQQEVSRLGGSMNLWRAGPGLEECAGLKTFNSLVEPNVLALQHELQRAFDPAGVFNTGRAHR